MKKLFFCVTLALSGLMTACVDKNEAVDAESKPEWLGESIYQELKNPTHLTGTFSTYLRLIDDLGLAEMLNRTGSKTLFPANDEAFSRFFQSNSWGVTSYEQLSTAQKKMLLYNSMLDNAILVGMLSNVSNTNRDEGVDHVLGDMVVIDPDAVFGRIEALKQHLVAVCVVGIDKRRLVQRQILEGDIVDVRLDIVRDI